MATGSTADDEALVRSMALASVAELCEAMPTVLACAKATSGRYVYSNRAFAERAGCRHPAAVIGQTARTLFPPELAETYEAQDRRVLETGRPVSAHLELIPAGHDRGSAQWHVTSKSRVLDDRHVVLGLIVLSVPSSAAMPQAAPLAAVLESVRADLTAAWRPADLARLAGVPQRRFDRLVRRAYGMSTSQLILRCRLDEALHLLSHTDLTVGSIASRTGFYDQASFTRRFRAATGMTPGTYRATHSVR